MFKLTGNARRDYPGLIEEYLRLKDLLAALREHNKSQDGTIKSLRKNIQELNAKFEAQIA